ncbi:MAG: bacillithiol system redox-active protein YtxJ [Polaribacter sp.]|jgi:bacillithiol system protein YtxJ|nr:bacillithiol system redox-active protein YtxJ [Polaribacter sp.]MBT5100204.1 bacillithiol system redox-active protein YtxJ [Polaribacter sp.]MBT5644811.1 bacillithiol system redox-active protein YtxJ [Polaribacter sp.]MDA9277659.1 bacillithiol system redox-active protein YtxJ [Polaribacter sp.]MDB4009586.1 bacillithiol system redox-active protein YtxJ [Polaribacter sp.]
MGLFEGVFKSNKKEKGVAETFINWIPLTNLEQLATIKSESETEFVLIFKHSTRCGISRMVIKQFENLFTAEMKKLKVYYLDLLNHRNISDEIGYSFQVVHQSPQLIVVRNGVTVAHSSHNEIIEINLTKFQ